VGRFLEHSRIFWFRNGGNQEIYIGSADMMPRNLSRRVEVLCPVGSARLVSQLRQEILDQYLADDATARHMCSDGRYTPKPAHGGFNSQAAFLNRRNSDGIFDQKFEASWNGNSNGRSTPVRSRGVPANGTLSGAIEQLRQSANDRATELEILRRTAQELRGVRLGRPEVRKETEELP